LREDVPDALTADVRKRLSPHTTGDECASPGTGVRHAMPDLVSTLHASGVVCPSATPLARGPRKRGQFSSGTSAANAGGTPATSDEDASRRAARERMGFLRSGDWMPHWSTRSGGHGAAILVLPIHTADPPGPRPAKEETLKRFVPTPLAFALPLFAFLAWAPGALAAEVSPEDRWPGWRGEGQGVARGARLPLEWTASRNVAWKTEIPGRGHSAPIVWGDRLFLTTAIEGDVVPGAKAVKHMAEGQEFVHPDATGADRRHTFKLLSLDAKDGRVLWERTVWEGTPVDSRHKKASFASPTATTDGERVYAYFGSEGLFAYDFDGKLAWKFDPGVVATMGVGVGSSPLLYRDLVILLCDEDNGEKSFLVALDRRTGKETWRVPRKVEISWATPVIVHAASRDELVTAGNQLVQAYDPATGRELWRMKGLESNAVTTPLVGDGVVVVSSGYPSKVSIAVVPGGSGDITDSPRVLWRYNKGSAYVPSPILYDGHV
jgi:outer membrane protein assembly factor BamB